MYRFHDSVLWNPTCVAKLQLILNWWERTLSSCVTVGMFTSGPLSPLQLLQYGSVFHIEGVWISLSSIAVTASQLPSVPHTWGVEGKCSTGFGFNGAYMCSLNHLLTCSHVSQVTLSPTWVLKVYIMKTILLGKSSIIRIYHSATLTLFYWIFDLPSQFYQVGVWTM